jgi:hypothetical protein
VFCRATNAYERFSQRIATDGRHSNDEVQALQARWQRIRPQVSEPLELGAPVIRVDTTDAYDPPVDTIIELIKRPRT